MRHGRMMAAATFAVMTGAAAYAGGAGTAQAGHPVAVELFTSQGCSSCPPADAIMARLADEPGVIAITRPVTYWDRLGWKDTLARPANTDLQRAYAQRKMAGAGVYTPQTVVQGRAGAVGGQEARIRSLIAAARNLPQPAVTIGTRADGGRSVALAGKAPADARLMLVSLKRQTVVRIGDGENGGRQVRYTNHVVGERSLGVWKGGAQTFALAPAALRVTGADRHVVLVRQGAAGPILAARYL